MKMDDKNKKPKMSHMMEDDMPMHKKASLDVLKALRNLAQNMMADSADEGEDGGVVARVDVKKVMPSELPDGNEKPSRLDEMTKDLNETDESETRGESMGDQDEEEDKDLFKQLSKHLSKKA